MWRVLLLCLCLVGCSPTAEVAKSAIVIDKTFETIQLRADSIDEEVLVGNADPKVITGITRDIKDIAGRGREEIQRVQRQIPALEDEVKLWEKSLYLGLVVLALGGVIFLLVKLKLLTVFGRIVQWVSSVIPDPASDQQDAEVLKKTAQGEMPPEATTAYFRGKYPEIERAWEKNSTSSSPSTSSSSSEQSQPPLSL